MYFRYGAYSHPTGEVGLTSIDRFASRTSRGAPLTIEHTWNLTLDVVANGQAAIRQRIDQIERAYRLEGYDAAFYHDDGQRSAHYLTNFDSVQGVQIVMRPSWIGDSGAEYATMRTGQMILSAQYFHPQAATLIDFTESITLQGRGGPRRAIVTVDVGDPEQYQLAQRTPSFTVQQGTATTRLSYYLPQPTLPQQWLDEEASSVVRTTFVRKGIRFFQTQWSYLYHSPRPLSGSPRIL